MEEKKSIFKLLLWILLYLLIFVILGYFIFVGSESI